MLNNDLFSNFCKSVYKIIGNKVVVLGGYCLGSSYMRWLKWSLCNEMCILFDETEIFYGVKIHRTSEMKRLLAPEKCVFFAFDDYYFDKFNEFADGKAQVYMLPNDFGYYRYLEDMYGIDVARTIKSEDFDYTESTATNSGASRQMGLLDVLNEVNFDFQVTDKKILDIGCGKGGAMIIMHTFDFKSIDGIEISPMISKIAQDNFKKLGYENCHVSNVSALDYDYSDYDVFYMYDPFKGDIFKEVVGKMFKQAKKGALFIYANPYMDDAVVESGFKFVRSIDTDFFIRIVNVYVKE